MQIVDNVLSNKAFKELINHYQMKLANTNESQSRTVLVDMAGVKLDDVQKQALHEQFVEQFN
jgi:ABC-type ATPase with predicted acetyltransferase domain